MSDKDLTTQPHANLVTRQADSRLPAARSAEDRFQKALEATQSSGLRRLFPSQLDRAMSDHQLAEFKQVGDARRRGLSMTLEAKLQAIEEELNETLMKGKAELRADREIYIQSQFDRLIGQLNTRMESFLKELDRRYANLAAIECAPIRAKEEQRIALDYERYAHWVDSKINEFQAAIAEGVRR